MNSNNDILCWITTGLSTILTVEQADTLYQLISLICTIVCAVFTVAYTIWKWWKKASEDNKITKDEVDELINNIKDNVNKK